jgi:hypothetical protein
VQRFPREQFLELCNELRKLGPSAWKFYSLSEALKLTQRAPVYTVKELRALLSKIEPGNPSSALTVASTELAGAPRRKGAQLFRALVGLRSEKLEEASRSSLNDTVVKRYRDASDIMLLLRAIAVDLKGFENYGLDVGDWNNWFSHISRWAHFSLLEQDRLLREEERQFALEMIRLLPKDQHPSIALPGRDREGPSSFGPKIGEEFHSFVTELRSISETSCAEIILAKFEEPRGLDSFWGERDLVSPLKLELFDPASAFHSRPEYRARLRELAEAARTNPVVQDNFVTFLSQLAYGASRGGSFGFEDCRKLLKDANETLLPTLWQAAVCNPLNVRETGTLREHRKGLIAWGLKEEFMPVPEWWQKLEAEGVWSERDAAQKTDAS